MSQPIVLTTRHQLGIEGVKQRVDERYESLKANGLLDKVADVRMSWDGDTANVSAKALGQKMRGTIAVTDHNLTITIHLPTLLKPFREAIVAFIETQEDAVKGAKGQ